MCRGKLLFRSKASGTLALRVYNDPRYDRVHQRGLWFGIIQIVHMAAQEVPNACLLQHIVGVVLAQSMLAYLLR